jgi:hypothetical protein
MFLQSGQFAAGVGQDLSQSKLAGVRDVGEASGCPA